MRKDDQTMPILAVSEAKNKLTILRREALTGKEIILADAKRKDEQAVSLISTELLDELCELKTFSYEWVDKPVGSIDHYSLWSQETGIYGVGKSKKEAIENFIDNAQDYARIYFDDLPYYLSRSNPNRNHYWYLRRILRCNENREMLYKVLGLRDLDL
ncbi:MAG: hypothetical protein ACOX6L_07835 [Syntrophomonadaceae bacterium]|jgi:hypothetical protein